MNITLTPGENEELEVIIRGDLTRPEVPELIAALNAAGGLSRLFVYREDQEILCDAQDIDYFEACQGRVLAHLNGETLDTRSKLYHLAEQFRTKGFIQINKGTLVNVRRVASIHAEFSGNYIAELKNGERLSISRSYVRAFRHYVLKEY